MLDEKQYRRIGNLHSDELHQPLGGGRMPMVPQWTAQGIGHLVTRPSATDRFTTEELTDMGLVGVILVLPTDEEQS